jgi:hypothetical protein
MQAKRHSISIQFQMEIQINQDVDNLTSLIMIDRSIENHSNQVISILPLTTLMADV